MAFNIDWFLKGLVCFYTYAIGIFILTGQSAVFSDSATGLVAFATIPMYWLWGAFSTKSKRYFDGVKPLQGFLDFICKEWMGVLILVAISLNYGIIVLFPGIFIKPIFWNPLWFTTSVILTNALVDKAKERFPIIAKIANLK